MTRWIIIITASMVFSLFAAFSQANSLPLRSLQADSNRITGYVINQTDDTLHSSNFDGGQHNFIPFKDFTGTAEQYMTQASYMFDVGSDRAPKFAYVLEHITDNTDPTNKGCVFIFYPSSDYSDYYVLSAPVGKDIKCAAKTPNQTGLNKSNVLIVSVTS